MEKARARAFVFLVKCKTITTVIPT